MHMASTEEKEVERDVAVSARVAGRRGERRFRREQVGQDGLLFSLPLTLLEWEHFGFCTASFTKKSK